MRWVLLLSLSVAGCTRHSFPESTLIGAARSGNVESIKRLVAAGADVNQRGGSNNWTAVMHAVHKNQRGSVEALLDEGADANARTADGSTALMMAAGYGYTDIVEILLAHGADAAVEADGGWNALAAAVGGVPDIDRFTVGRCQTETVKALLTRAPNLKLKDATSLRAARLGGCAEVVRMVSERGL
jgi:hypothetical protein